MTIRAAFCILFLAGSLFAQAPAPKPAPVPARKPAPAAAPASPTPAPAQAARAAQEPEEVPPDIPGALFPAVVARVNGRALYGRDLEQRINAQLLPLGNPAWKNLKEEYRQELLGQSMGSLIAAELIYQKAVSMNLRATDAEVKAEFDKALKDSGSDSELNIALANRGMDRGIYRRELSRNLTVAKLVDQTISKKITVTPAEVNDYYAANKASFERPELIHTAHILILLPQSATPEQEKLARMRADALQARARKGEDFARLAREYSMDVSASNGGDIGTVPRGQLAKEYEDAAFALAVGGISGVVRTRLGFHIIKVLERRAKGMATLEEVRADLTEFLKNQRIDAELSKVVESMRGTAKIEILIPLSAPVSFGNVKASSPRP